MYFNIKDFPQIRKKSLIADKNFWLVEFLKSPDQKQEKIHKEPYSNLKQENSVSVPTALKGINIVGLGPIKNIIYIQAI